MATYGDLFTTSLPNVGAAGPQYATDLDAILSDIMTRLASKVPLSSVLVTADLNLGGFSVVNANSVQFANQTSIPGATPSARLGVANGNLYYTGLSGAVQITAGGQVNAAGIGGITGDYGGSNPAQERFDVANTRYDFFTNPATNTWAYLRGLGFDFAGGTTSAARARLGWTGTVNQSYQLPATQPVGPSQFMQMDSTGQMTVSNVLPINTNIGVSGVGHVTRGTRAVTQAFTSGTTLSIAGSPPVNISGLYGFRLPATSTCYVPVQFPDAEASVTSINSVSLVNQASGSAVTYQLITQTGAVLSGAIAGTSVTSAAANITMTLTTPLILSGGTFLILSVSTGASSVDIYGHTINTTVV